MMPGIGPVELIILCVIGVVLLAIGAAAFLALRSYLQRSNAREVQDSRQRVPCPHCGELILPDAKVCRYCGRDIS